eukprot:jgi/Mesvir1/16399/Mv18137-RA.1
MAPVVGGDGRKQLANAGRSLANAAGASFGGGEGVSAVPRSGTLKAGARGGGKEEKAGLPRSAKGDGAAGMGLSPEMMAQMNALMGGFQQLGIGGAQGLGAAVRVPAPSVQEGAHGGGGGSRAQPCRVDKRAPWVPGHTDRRGKNAGPSVRLPRADGCSLASALPTSGYRVRYLGASGWNPVPHGVRSSPRWAEETGEQAVQVPECGHRHCRCTSSDSTSSDSEGSGRGRAGGRGTGGRLTDLPVTRGVNLLEYLPAGRALSVVWDVEDHKYHQRTAPKHMETAIQGHNGNMVAWLNVQRAPVLRQQKEGTGLGLSVYQGLQAA